MRVIGPGCVVVSFTRPVYVTSRRTEHHTVLLAIVADSTASDGDSGNTGVCVSCVETLNTKNLLGSSLSISIRLVSKITHRTISTATIYIMVYPRLAAYRASTDGHVGITIYMAATHSVAMTAAAAIDITHLGTAKVASVAAGNSDWCNTYSTATHRHVCISTMTSSQCLVQGF